MATRDIVFRRRLDEPKRMEMESRSLPIPLVARIGAVLIGASGLVGAVAHVLNPIGMEDSARAIITVACLGVATVVWLAPWTRLPSHALWAIANSMFALKVVANVIGGYGPYSYAIHFVLIAVWMGLALPRGSVLLSAPVFAGAYILPMLIEPTGASVASTIVVVPVCVTCGECIGWIADRLRRVDAAEESHLEDLDWLLGAATKLAEDQDPEEVTRLIAQLSLRMPGASGAVVLVKDRGRQFSTGASIDWPGKAVNSVALGEEPAYVAAAKRRSLLGWNDPLCSELAARVGVPGVCVIPLFGTRGCLGIVLVAGDPQRTEGEAALQQLGNTLAIQAGLALERQSMHASLRDASLHDDLTQLGNRRKSEKRLAALHSGESLVLIDLDHFKQVNDSSGHQRGDDVLRELADHLRSTLRADDAIFRMGGDEFMVVLEASPEGAGIATERLLGGWRLRNPDLTLSMGIASHRDGDTAAETFLRADRALYAAKEGGRDQLRVAE